MGQVTCASLAWDGKKKRTRREIFFAEMDAAIPWTALEGVIAPHDPRAGKGRRPLPLSTMLRIHFLQHWFNLSDLRAEEILYDSEPMRRFAHIEFGQDVMPDETTILHFRHLLERHAWRAQIFDGVRDLLRERGLLLRAGTVADATLIAAPPSTKNAAKARDPEMSQARKGTQ